MVWYAYNTIIWDKWHNRGLLNLCKGLFLMETKQFYGQTQEILEPIHLIGSIRIQWCKCL